MFQLLSIRLLWMVLIVGATLLLTKCAVAAPQLGLTLLLLGAGAAAFVSGLVPGLLGAGLLVLGIHTFLDLSTYPVGVDPRSGSFALCLFGFAALLGYLSMDRLRRNRAMESLRATVQRLVDERVAESAATNRELSVECSERLRIEETLRIREIAIEAMMQGVIITDARRKNVIIYVNEGFTRLTGYAPKDALQRNCRFLQGRETSPEAIEEVRKAIREERSYVIELINYRKDGSPFWNALSITPIRNERGECTHFVGIQMDVTNFKRIEEQFRQSQKMEAVGHLASGVAHDFNNLLTVINGCSELIKYTMPADDPNRPFIDEIYQAGDRAAGLTRQLLTFSRKSTVQPRIVDLNSVLADLDKILSRLLSADIRMKVTFGESLPKVKLDPGLFEQVVLNLVVNARDAMPRGGELGIETRLVHVTEDDARLQPGQTPGDYVLLRVSDTGTGMDKATQARLFEPFFTTKPAGKGTGLGLATVYGIVKSSDSFISLWSQVGKGTSFSIFIPANLSDSEQELEIPRLRNPISNPGIETILLVEDEPGVRSLTKHALESQGYFILEAANGQEALEVAHSADTEIHLLLTDVVMPEMGGRELSERLRLKHGNLRVVYMSGYTDDAVLQHGISQSEMHFLQKPFSMNDLMAKVRGVLDEAMQETIPA